MDSEQWTQWLLGSVFQGDDHPEYEFTIAGGGGSVARRSANQHDFGEVPIVRLRDYLSWEGRDRRA